MVFSRFASAVALTTLLVSSVSAFPRIDTSVHRALRQQGTVNLIVTFNEGTTAAINAVHEADYGSRGDKIEALVKSLEANAASSQAELVSILAQESAGSYESVEHFWISNQAYFKGASFALVEKLASLSNIREIREEIVLPLPQIIPVANETIAAIRPLANEYGITKVAADQVWAAGFNGQGIVVSSIDTGVLYTHEALKNNWRSSYGWYDPSTKKTTPTDGNGHGTHTMGTIAGAGGIGVAPGSTWISCRGCTSSGCTESDLLTCAQFITCPTDVAGNNKDCSKAPHVVSNSWGGGQGDTFYKAAVDAWQAAGIIPIFANGNSGPACTTANSPGDYANVIAVGATDSSDGLASFSSKGPSKGGLLKPEVSAPGVSVRSAWNTGNTIYNSISGTSMATPHVTGVVALLLSAKNTLKYNDIKDLLTGTVDTASLKTSGYNCGTSKDGVFPNNMYGYGRVNAFSAYKKATSGGPSPTSAPTSGPTSAPTTKPPAPTPAPTNNKCAGLGWLQCYLTDGCSYDFRTGKCVPV